MKCNECDKHKKMIEQVKEEVYELFEIYKKDKNVFNKIINLFNCHLQNNSILSLESALGRDIEKLLKKDYLKTILAYDELLEEDLKLELEEGFEYELNYCSIYISNLILKSNAAKDDPIGVSSIECLAFYENSVMLKVTRNDNNSIIFKADEEDLKGIKSVMEEIIKEIILENETLEYKD